jgi:hypothetical protein
MSVLAIDAVNIESQSLQCTAARRITMPRYESPYDRIATLVEQAVRGQLETFGSDARIFRKQSPAGGRETTLEGVL